MKSVLHKLMVAASIILMSISVFAQKDEAKVYWLDSPELLDGSLVRVSPNGRYAVGYINGGPSFLWDRTTAKAVIVQSPDGSCIAESVSDNGILAGIFPNPEYMQDGMPLLSAGFYTNGVWTALPAIPGVQITDLSTPSATSISSDGKIIGGMTAKDVMFYSGCTWTNGDLDPLLGGGDFSVGAKVLSMSADGNVLCGWAYDQEDNLGPIVWNKSWSPDYKKLAVVGQANAVSANGKYVTGYYYDETDEMQGFLWSEDGGLVNIPKLEGTSKMESWGVSNDGTVVGYCFRMLFDRVAFIYKGGVTYNLENYLSEFYGYENTTTNTFFSPGSISASGNTICGWGETLATETERSYRVSWVIALGDEDYSSVNDVKVDDLKVWSNGKVVNIEYSSNERAVVEIIDITGRTIKNLAIENGTTSTTLNNSGLYIVKVGNNSKKIVVR